MRRLARYSLVLMAFTALAGCGPFGSGTSQQTASSGSSPANSIPPGTPSPASAAAQAGPANSLACPSLAEVVSATGLATFTKTEPGGHAVDKNNGQTIDTCAYSDAAQTAAINVQQVSLLPGYIFAKLKSQSQSAGAVRDVPGFGSGAYEIAGSPSDSGGFSDSCHLVVNAADTAVLQVVAGSQSAPYSALCSQAEAVARLLLR
jgi:hypothetical protein